MNLLRIHSISILTLLAICVLTNGSPIKDTKDSRIVRIKTLEVEKQPRVLHAVDAQVRAHAPNKIKSSGSKSKNAYISNRQLLTKLGLSKLRIPASHSRKRLAIESRHHARPDDSHMFVIKLPPSPHYYTNPNAIPKRQEQPAATVATQSVVAPSKNPIHDDYGGSSRSKKVSSFGFQLNGKPGRIYHWNIPVLKKIFTGDGRSNSKMKNEVDVSEIIDIKNTPTWSKPWENDTIEKSYSKFGLHGTKSLKRKSPSYYAPVKTKKNKVHNYFPGNGKPRGFYVIQHNKVSHKPSKYYRKLIY